VIRGRYSTAYRHTRPVTDDPAQAAREQPEYREYVRRLTEQVYRALDVTSDRELIGELAAVPISPNKINPLELNRRLKVSIEDLTVEVKAARVSSDRLGKTLVGLTRILVVLTLALVGLTVVLIVLAVSGG
jgi:hypothetical protein